VNRETKRRAVLGGLAVAAVGGTSYLLGGSSEPVRGLRPVDSLADSGDFAYVGGVGDGDTLAVEVAMREREQSEQEIVLFADGDDPVRATIPPLRSFWRFDAPVGGRSPGRDTLRVDDASLPVRRLPDPSTGGDAAVRLTPRITWQSDYLAHARAYGDRNGGRVVVAFRLRTTDGLTPDALELRDPDGAVAGRHTVPEDVYQTAFDVNSLVPREGDAELVGLRDGAVVDSFPMFYH
jgi:hypothetical protein